MIGKEDGPLAWRLLDCFTGGQEAWASYEQWSSNSNGQAGKDGRPAAAHQGAWRRGAGLQLGEGGGAVGRGQEQRRRAAAIGLGCGATCGDPRRSKGDYASNWGQGLKAQAGVHAGSEASTQRILIKTELNLKFCSARKCFRFDLCFAEIKLKVSLNF